MKIVSFFPNPQKKNPNWKLQNKKIIKIFEIFEIKLQCLYDGRCHPRKLFFVFIKLLQNCSHVFFPNIWQNTAEIPNSMGMGTGKKSLIN